MGLSPEQKDRLAAALSENRQAVLCGLVREVAAHNLDRDTRIRHLYKMRSAEPSLRRALLREGARAGNIVSELGDAMFGKGHADGDVIDQVEELIALDQIGAEAIDRVCDKTLLGGAG